MLAMIAGGAHAADAKAATSGVAVTIYSAPSRANQPQYGQQLIMQARAGRESGSGEAGFGVVKETRLLDLPRGVSRYRFTDVAARIDPTTVKFRGLGGATTTTLVLEQNFEFDLVNPAKLLDKYIDEPVAVILRRREESKRAEAKRPASKRVTGALLSNDGGPILRTTDSVFIAPPGGQVELPKLPAGLITRPTLEWLVDSQTAGPRPVEVAYQTEGLSWYADYTAILAADEKALDLAAWVTIANRSGASFRDARLKLVAGDVHRVQPPQQAQRRVYAGVALALYESLEERGFQEKAFFEYHLYTLGRRSTIADNEIKQIEMFEPVAGVPVEKLLVYYGFPGSGIVFGNEPNQDRSLGTRSNRDVDIYVRFKNEEKAHMGMPLPAGRIRLYKRDPADRQTELVGADWIDHTPKDEEVLLRLGSAFDIVGERKQTDFQIQTGPQPPRPAPRQPAAQPAPGRSAPGRSAPIALDSAPRTSRPPVRAGEARPDAVARPEGRDLEQPGRFILESFEITLRNHKQEPVRVIVKENLYRWLNWGIVNASHDYEKKDARTIHFPVDVPANGETKVTYTVRYTW
jgi:hypothetical protein